MGSKLFYCVIMLLLMGVFPKLGTTQTIRPTTQKEVKIYDPTSGGTGSIGLRASSGTSAYSLVFPSLPPLANEVLGISSINGGIATMAWASAVNSFSGGTTGLIPNTASTGAVTLSGTLNVTNGGTGATTLAGIIKGNDANAMTAITGTTGGITYWSDANTIAASAEGAVGRALISGGTGAPTWYAPTPGSILFAGANGMLQQNNANLFFDSTNSRLGIGIAVPASALHIDRTGGSALKFSSSATGQTATDGFDIGIDETGRAVINQRENYDLIISTNNIPRATFRAASGGQVEFTGSVLAAAFFEISDIRQKDILKRDGDIVYFTWKDKRDELVHTGYIAQEVQERNPHQVMQKSDGMLALNYTELLVEKVRALEKKIEILEAEIKVSKQQAFKRKKRRSY